MDEATKGRSIPPKSEEKNEVKVKAGSTIPSESPTGIARRTELPYVIYNRDVGVMQKDVRDEIADIKEKDHFVRDLLVRLEKLSELNEAGRIEVIKDVGDLVLKALRFTRAELQIEKAKSNPKTLWELLSKLLMDMVPKSLMASSETEQLLGHLEEMKEILTVEAKKIRAAERERAEALQAEKAKEARNAMGAELNSGDKEYQEAYREVRGLLKKLEQMTKDSEIISTLMAKNRSMYQWPQKGAKTAKPISRVQGKWDSLTVDRVKKFFEGSSVEFSLPEDAVRVDVVDQYMESTEARVNELMDRHMEPTRKLLEMRQTYLDARIDQAMAEREKASF